MNKYKTLKELFDHYFEHVDFDKRFCEKIYKFLIGFLSKNDDHVNFFGGNLIGVYRVRWNYSDSDTWWDDIFDIDETLLKRDLDRLDVIVPDRIVSSDALNHAFIYTLHRIHESNKINDTLREETKIRLMTIMNMRFLTSLLARYYPYGADPGVAERVYNRLSKRYDLKVYGNWGKMLYMRSENYVSPQGRYYKTYTEYVNDPEILIMITDAQGRIRETVKEITALFHKTLQEDAKILSNSSTISIDGTKLLKDLQRQSSIYTRYIKQVIVSKDSYKKDALESIVYKAVPSLTPDFYDKLTNTFLERFTDKKQGKILNELVDTILTFSFDFLKSNDIKLNDLPGITYRLKHVYMSGRVKDEDLEKARSLYEKLVEMTDKKMKNTPTIPERCAFMLYLVLRTLTMNFYK